MWLLNLGRIIPSKGFAVAMVCIAGIIPSINAQIALPRLISDGVVLQRDRAIRLHGTASPFEEVQVILGKVLLNARADSAGRWAATLPAQKAGGPHTITFRGKNELVLRDVLFGDVWVCSGQSNMELTMERVKEKYRNEVATSQNSHIRHFHVAQRYNFRQRNDDLPYGKWESADPETILRFSAVGYFFAKDLYDRYQIPIGLLDAAVGGSPAEAWMSEEALKAFPNHLEEAMKFRDEALIKTIETREREASRRWYSNLNERDPGIAGKWKTDGSGNNGWVDMQIPGYWDDVVSPFDGSAWYKRTVVLGTEFTDKPVSLWMGRVVDADSVFVNGTFVGTTSYQYPPRRYSVPPGVIRKGENTVTVRVINGGGRGGFVPDKPYFFATASDTVDMRGTWLFREGAKTAPAPGQTFIRWKPLGLFNGMIAPLLSFPVKGVIWYQGEANTHSPEEYKTLFPALVKCWRKEWNQGDFPFLFVQLASFMEPSDEPGESNWAATRQAQLEARSLPNTGMAVAIDLGEWNDIHPLNKKDVGKRLAIEARRLAGDKTAVGSPVPDKTTFSNTEATIGFANAGKKLVSKDGAPLRHFTISSDGKTFVRATAEIRGTKVIVKADNVTNPVAVRYAWADNPEAVNLYNAAGLPASPFEVRKK